jgi:hypothetical protein
MAGRAIGSPNRIEVGAESHSASEDSALEILPLDQGAAGVCSRF